VGASAQPLPTATDPLFGLTYDSTAVKFEPALYSQCLELTNARWNRKMWIFGRTTTSNITYVVIGGFYVKREGTGNASPAIEADPVGAVIRLKGKQCELIGPAREVFDYPSSEIGARVLKGLANDAVCRYIRAFGGKREFLDAIERQHIRFDDPHSTILKEAVFAASNTCG